MKYEIIGGSYPAVTCYLSSGEQMKTESGAMIWMSPNMQMETRGGGFGKMFAKAFTGVEGRFVPLADTIESFRQVIDGEADDIPENAFFMVGDINEARAKAATMEA